MNKIKLFFQKNNKDVKKENNKEKFDYFKIVIITFLIVFLFNMFCLQTACVNGSSMYPTLENGQYLLINKMEKDYDRYDIIVARSNGIHIIKRIIGLPGETVQIINNNIYINDKIIYDPINNINMDYYGIAEKKVTLKDNEYFVMGDNRNNSADSRDPNVGVISKSKISGSVIFRFFPFKVFVNE